MQPSPPPSATTRRLAQSRSELPLNLLSSSITTALCVSALNPLDVLRIRFQTRPRPATINSITPFIRQTLQTESIFTIWKCGIGVNAASVAISSGIRLGLYVYIRDTLVWMRGPDSLKSALDMWLGGFLSGALGFYLATPFFAAKIKSQQWGAAKTGFEELQHLIHTRTAYRGSSILVVRGALLSAGASLGYDLTKTIGRRHAREGPWMHVLGSISASFLATTLSCPFDVLMTRHAVMRETSIMTCAKTIWREGGGGPRGFYTGWTLFFARVTPLWIIQLPFYEQVRSLLGIGFMD